MQDLMLKQGLIGVGGTPERMLLQLQTEIPKWKLVVKNGNIKGE
jgi:hypothetical protein